MGVVFLIALISLVVADDPSITTNDGAIRIECSSVNHRYSSRTAAEIEIRLVEGDIDVSVAEIFDQISESNDECKVFASTKVWSYVSTKLTLSGLRGRRVRQHIC
jgi:hypothetical protein